MAVDLPGNRTLTGRSALVGLLLVSGVALAGAGTYLHFSIAAQVRVGQCDGCARWHPLFVVAPIVTGVAIVAVAVSLSRR
jgi:hypothetical protein